MPVTSLALLVFSLICVAGLMLWAVGTWGFVTMLPILLALVLVARWALAHVPHDDGTA
jgi:uncharacterized membrane protein